MHGAWWSRGAFTCGLSCEDPGDKGRGREVCAHGRVQDLRWVLAGRKRVQAEVRTWSRGGRYECALSKAGAASQSRTRSASERDQVLPPPQGCVCRTDLAWVSRACAEVQTPGVRTRLSQRRVWTPWDARLCSRIRLDGSCL